LGNLREPENVEDLGVDGKIILKLISMILCFCGDMDRINNAEDSNKLGFVDKRVMNIVFDKIRVTY
jgi:hypothetical protein